ncbi:MAG: hypothetical protein NW237_14920 [Cyanobacteriota bacterium]|nr:hypothetical protein [Cyanobacteriota bacterium]
MTLQSLKNLLDRLLIANIFLVFGGFVWFVFSVSGAFLGIPLGYKLWIQLWLPLFQPALGILMAGAIVSGLASWWLKRFRQP